MPRPYRARVQPVQQRNARKSHVLDDVRKPGLKSHQEREKTRHYSERHCRALVCAGCGESLARATGLSNLPWQPEHGGLLPGRGNRREGERQVVRRTLGTMRTASAPPCPLPSRSYFGGQGRRHMSHSSPKSAAEYQLWRSQDQVCPSSGTNVLGATVHVSVFYSKKRLTQWLPHSAGKSRWEGQLARKW